MEAFLVLVLIIVLILVLATRSQITNSFVKMGQQLFKMNSDINAKLDALQRRQADLQSRLEQLSNKGVETWTKDLVPPVQEQQQPEQKKPPVEKPIDIVPPSKIEPIEKIEVRETPIQPDIPVIEKPVIVEDTGKHLTTEPQKQPINPKPKPQQAVKPKTDFEKFVGENLINKIGIGILVLSVFFFIRLAIEKEWINEAGRVGIGVLCGGILIGVAHFLRKSYKAFSSVLVGGGLAVLYITITLAFREYQLISQAAAFGIMVAITLLAVVLSLGYDRQELAVIAIVGGFASPMLVSTGQGNFHVLFIYVAILNVGMLLLAYFKKWNIVNWVAYVFTVILYGGWLGVKISDDPQPPYAAAFGYASLFYFIFLAMNQINNLRKGEQFNASDIGLLISNNLFYYSAGMTILYHWDKSWQGLFTVLMAVINMALGYFIKQTFADKADKRVIYMFVGMVVTFLTLAVPVQLDGNYITLFWAAESVVLLWLWQRGNLTFFKISSSAVAVLAIISLLMDWNKYYFAYQTDDMVILPAFMNKVFITGLCLVAALFIKQQMLRKEKSDFYFKDVTTHGYRATLMISAMTLLYLLLATETWYQAEAYYNDKQAAVLGVGAISAMYALALHIWLMKSKSTQAVYVVLPLGAVFGLLYLFFFHYISVSARDTYFSILLSDAEKDPRIVNSLMPIYWHLWGSIALVVVALLALYQIFFKIKANNNMQNLLAVAGIFLLLFACSSVLDHIVVIRSAEATANNIIATGEGFDSYNAYYSAKEALLDQSQRFGYSIIWSLVAFGLIVGGMRMKLRDVRVLALVLFLITVVKLFIYDLKVVSETARVIAFVLLGILLLIVSFMYQRVKKTLFDDHGEEEKKE